MVGSCSSLLSPCSSLFYSSNHCVSQIAGSEACPLDGCPVPSGICGLHLFVVQRWAVRVCSFIKQFCSSAAYPTRFLKHPPFCGYVLSFYLSLCLSFLSLCSQSVSSVLELIIDCLPFSSQAHAPVTLVTEHTCAKMHIWKRNRRSYTHVHCAPYTVYTKVTFLDFIRDCFIMADRCAHKS